MKKIVIVDSSETFVKYISRVLSRLGYEVHAAFDIEAGFSIIDRKKPDLVLTEMHVGNHDGLELCARLRSFPDTSGIPVVIVTTDGTSEGMEQARQAGCSDYLTKPMTVRDIHSILQRNLSFPVLRRVIRLNICVDAVIGSAGLKIETRTVTLGEGGMLVRSDHPIFQGGSRLDIVLHLSSAEAPLELKGEVIYRIETANNGSQRGIGIQFIDIEKDAAAQLTRFIEAAIRQN
jgi:CheY-like chemotaxis protein